MSTTPSLAAPGIFPLPSEPRFLSIQVLRAVAAISVI
jgi:hypothetical protein